MADATEYRMGKYGDDRDARGQVDEVSMGDREGAQCQRYLLLMA
jgi:hypothetical protein